MKESKTKKFFVALAALTAVCCITAFVACTGNSTQVDGNDPDTPSVDTSTVDTPTVDLNENFTADDVYGMWSYTFQDDENNRVGFSTVVKGDQMTTVQESKLILLNIGDGEENTYRNSANNYSWSEGNNYEFIKNLYNSETGLYIWQVYFGTFTVDASNRTVTLNTPDYYSYYVFFGNCAVGTSTMFQDQGGTDLLTADNEYYTSEGQSGERDGLYDFNSELAEYHHSSGGELPFTVQLDLNTMTFTYYYED